MTASSFFKNLAVFYSLIFLKAIFMPDAIYFLSKLLTGCNCSLFKQVVIFLFHPVFIK